MKIHRKNIIIGLIVLLMMGTGILLIVFRGKDRVEPGMVKSEYDEQTPEKTVTADIKTVTEWYEAVGTVRPRTETRIEAQISGQVTDVAVRAGDMVEKDQVMVVLDSREVNARLSQARQALKTTVSQKQQTERLLDAAQAVFNEASSDYQRIKNFYESEAATKQELERSEARFYQARAALKRAQEAVQGAIAGIRQAEEVVREAQVSLGYTQIKAPVKGEVIQRMIEPGDLALPGKPLVLMKTTENLQIEAFVREGLIGKVQPGIMLAAHIGALDKTVTAKVEEIIPYADPQTRTFLVKALLPPMEGVYPGMYGKLRIPYKTLDVIVIPPEAVPRVGELETVSVQIDGRWQKRYIKTGKFHEGRVEVLSGLSGNETLMVGESEHDRK
ncbi:MAG: efflux RND transporter periplasmic adaptor subunit [Desulfobacterales bacterium]